MPLVSFCPRRPYRLYPVLTASAPVDWVVDHAALRDRSGLEWSRHAFAVEDAQGFVDMRCGCEGRTAGSVAIDEVTIRENTVAIPDLVGLDLAATQATLISSGLALGLVTHEFSPAVPAGEVMGQVPVGGVEATLGEAVYLTVSSGPEPRGSLTVNIEPGAVVDGGAQWRIDGGPWQAVAGQWHGSGGPLRRGVHGGVQGGITATTGGGGCSIRPSTIRWATPPDQHVTIEADQTVSVTGEYSHPSSKATGEESVEFDPETPLYEPALPARRGMDGARVARVDSPLAVRLRSEDAVDPDTVWGVVAWSEGFVETTEWVVVGDDAADGWVVCVPEVPWHTGESITFAAGARTVHGDPVGPEEFTFVVTDSAGSDGDGLALVLDIPAFPDSAGPAWRVWPDALFDEPATIQVPVPADTDAAGLEVGYYYNSGEGTALVPEQRVEGWTVPDSTSVVSDEVGDWFQLAIRHGGTVQLRHRTPGPVPDSLSSRRPQPGELLVYFSMAGLLGLARVRKQSGHRQS